ncbi:MAG TPA: GIY-YIG nuclease family protein [Abditibacteriaceae bacterium]|jgi:excinuclease UvrABC nuclease subunit
MAAASPKTVSALHAFGSPGRVVRRPFEGKTDTRRRRKLKDVARELPKLPGVYFFYGINDRLIYVGKAKCLRERVRSYFADTAKRRPPKLRRLLGEIQRLEYQVCGSELEALLVERRLIAELLPILNRQHKRFSVYPYLLLSDEEFPRLTITRAEPIEGGAPEAMPLHPASPLENAPKLGDLRGLYLGPFTSPRSAYWTFEAIRNLFPLRSCEGEIQIDTNGRGCFYHEIGRCCGPCVGATDAGTYGRVCADLLQLLRTGDAPQLHALRERMTKLAEEWKFEDAAQIKEQLAAIEAVATRLQRLERMRRENNCAIVQDSACGNATVFLVQGGLVRRHFIVTDWEAHSKELQRALRNIFDAPPPVADWTAKAELDEMMILDRWLRANAGAPCIIPLNERSNRQWNSNAARRLRIVHQTSRNEAL